MPNNIQQIVSFNIIFFSQEMVKYAREISHNNREKPYNFVVRIKTAKGIIGISII